MRSIITVCTSSMALALGACASMEYNPEAVAPAPENITAPRAEPMATAQPMAQPSQQTSFAEPRELTEARDAYNAAVKSPAATTQTQFLRLADQQIRDATHELKTGGDTQRVNDLAYLAMRNIQVGDVLAQAEAKAGLASTATKLGAAGGGTEKLSVNGSVLFPFGKSDLLPASKDRLNDLADALKSEPDERVRLEGNTDSIGSDEFNKQLSESRAQAVKDYLVSKGISADRIETEGNGKDQPVVDNNTVDNRANNRRVEVRIEGEPQNPSPEK